jgi:hypothetical protein
MELAGDLPTQFSQDPPCIVQNQAPAQVDGKKSQVVAEMVGSPVDEKEKYSVEFVCKLDGQEPFTQAFSYMERKAGGATPGGIHRHGPGLAENEEAAQETTQSDVDERRGRATNYATNYCQQLYAFIQSEGEGQKTLRGLVFPSEGFTEKHWSTQAINLLVNPNPVFTRSSTLET